MVKLTLKWLLILLLAYAGCISGTESKQSNILENKETERGNDKVILKDFTANDLRRINKKLLALEDKDYSKNWHYDSQWPLPGGDIVLSSQGRYFVRNKISFSEQEELGLRGVSHKVNTHKIDNDKSNEYIEYTYIPWGSFSTSLIESLYVAKKDRGNYTYIFPENKEDWENLRSINYHAESWAFLIPEDILVKDFISGNFDKDEDQEVAVAFSVAGRSSSIDKTESNSLIGVFIIDNYEKVWRIGNVVTMSKFYSTSDSDYFDDGLMESYDGLQKLDIYHDGVEEIVLSTLESGGRAALPIFYVIRNIE